MKETQSRRHCRALQFRAANARAEARLQMFNLDALGTGAPASGVHAPSGPWEIRATWRGWRATAQKDGLETMTVWTEVAS